MKIYDFKLIAKYIFNISDLVAVTLSTQTNLYLQKNIVQDWLKIDSKLNIRFLLKPRVRQKYNLALNLLNLV